MQNFTQSRQQFLRTSATVVAAGTVAYVALVHGGSLISAQSGTRPVTAVAAEVAEPASAAATSTSAASSYNQMDDYVETLKWWHNHPDWMPDGVCD